MGQFVAFTSPEAFRLYLQVCKKPPYREVGAKLRYDHGFKLSLYPTRNGRWTSAGPWTAIDLDLGELPAILTETLPAAGIRLTQEDFRESDRGGLLFWFRALGVPESVFDTLEEKHFTIEGDPLGELLSDYFIGNAKRLLGK